MPVRQCKKVRQKVFIISVKKGETVYSIARAYSISLQDLTAINNISDVSSIKEGSVIFIPDADQVIDDVMVSTRKADSDAKRNVGLRDQKLPDRTKPSRPADLTRLEEKTPFDKPVSSELSGVRPEVASSQPVVEKTGPRIEEKQPTAENNGEMRLEKGIFFWPVTGDRKNPFWDSAKQNISQLDQNCLSCGNES
ncbi:MAG: LysM peptidoglycan-binding domain-containing protein [Desulfobacterales bacterium]|nr:LysM peptidoglycan-binding domain-containing protein [Desulfobacterales bacterium]